LAEPARALVCLHALTRRFSAEFAIRPFILAHPDRVYATLHEWTRDPSPHVRRLVSEGSRPRLPWGIVLKPLVAEPTPTLPLLEALQDDGSEYVRRSVANHLNDIAKDHPAVVADWLERHLPGASRERRALLRHASRTLVKRGDRRVLAAWGLDARLRGTAVLSVAPARIRLGGTLTIELALASTARKPQTLAIDYVVHHVRADGGTSPKVFKGWNLVLAAGEQRVLARRHAVRPITIRHYYPGVHRIAVQVNGQVVAEAGFELRT
jgi:3-methyladenine DNA glycosylase AlkC